MEVTVSHTAAKALSRLPRNTRELILDKIERMAADPAQAAQVKPIKGSDGLFRLRVGDWRVTYEINNAQQVVLVLDVQPRGGAYR